MHYKIISYDNETRVVEAAKAMLTREGVLTLTNEDGSTLVVKRIHTCQQVTERKYMNLWVDDLRDPREFLEADFAIRNFLWVKTIQEAISLLRTGEVYTLFLDHDLGNQYTSALAIVDWMAENWQDSPELWPRFIYVHSANPVGVSNMLRTIERYGNYDWTTKDGRGYYMEDFELMVANQF